MVKQKNKAYNTLFFTLSNDEKIALRNATQIGGIKIVSLYNAVLVNISQSRLSYLQWNLVNQASIFALIDNIENVHELDKLLQICFKVGVFDKDYFDRYFILTNWTMQQRGLKPILR